MYLLFMQALCVDCHSAQLLDEEANSEAVMEGVIGVLLHDFFGAIVIDEVRMTCIPTARGQESQHRLQVWATSLDESLPMPLALLEARLEEAICCILLEHFHIVVIDAVDVRPMRDDAQSTTHE